MPKITDIQKILVIGSGPIIIGQAAEFDYSGTQACNCLLYTSLFKTTFAVIVFIVIFAVIVWLMDMGFGALFRNFLLS